MVNNAHKLSQLSPQLIFSLNTDSFEKLHKELEIVYYLDLKKHTFRCFDSVVKNAFSFFIYHFPLSITEFRLMTLEVEGSQSD